MKFVGEVERIIYHKNGWGVFVLKTESDSTPTVKACGAFLDLKEGSHLEISGAFEDHPRYGPSFKVKYYSLHVPNTVEGLKRYLMASIPWLGPVTAGLIVDSFGADTIKVITETPERLLEIPRVTETRLEEIKTAWREDHINREILIFLSQFGLSRAMSDRVLAKYGSESKSVISEDPYLLTNVGGLGFIRVDRIAVSMGLDPNGEIRRRAALMHVLYEASQGEGHVYLPINELCYRLMKLELEGMDRSKWSLDEVAACAKLLQERGQVTQEEDRIYLANLFAYERESARVLIELLERPINMNWWASRGGFGEPSEDLGGDIDLSESQLMGDSSLAEFIEKYQQDNQIQFSAEQLKAVAAANLNRVVVVTGLPGTGKTTVMRSIASLFDRCGIPVSLCAPTGKAAKRMAEVARRPASTIHRMLGIGATYKERTSLPPGAIIVDEFSMVDVALLFRLLKALHAESHLIVIGDPAQLPSVGPGYVLHNLRESGKIPTVALSQIFRQAEKSDIIKNAHHIHKGESLSGGDASSDFNIFTHDSDPPLLEGLIKLVKRIMDKRRPEEFQIMAPMKRGVLGVENLNKVLRPIINPNALHGSTLTFGDLEFAIGDRVMVTKNDYQKKVFNGDSGTVSSIDREKSQLSVAIDGIDVPFEYGELKNLMHSYAITIHKSQGSEWPIVLLILTSSHGRMLERNLFYTGVTRARQRLILLCQSSAVSRAVSNVQAVKRNTTLTQFLQNKGMAPVQGIVEDGFFC